MTAFEEFTSEMNGKQVTVVGAGVSNTPLISLLLEAGAYVTVHDQKTADELGEL